MTLETMIVLASVYHICLFGAIILVVYPVEMKKLK